MNNLSDSEKPSLSIFGSIIDYFTTATTTRSESIYEILTDFNAPISSGFLPAFPAIPMIRRKSSLKKRPATSPKTVSFVEKVEYFIIKNINQLRDEGYYAWLDSLDYSSDPSDDDENSDNQNGISEPLEFTIEFEEYLAGVLDEMCDPVVPEKKVEVKEDVPLAFLVVDTVFDLSTSLTAWGIKKLIVNPIKSVGKAFGT